jgi:ferritin-like metal-binding protein YciE
MEMIMTKEEKNIQIALGLYLDDEWKKYLKTIKKIEKKLETEIVRLAQIHENAKLMDKLQAHIDKRHKKSRILFETAIKEVYGKGITINWYDFDCELGNGIVFKK